jgi:hypothetical protein
MNEEEKAAARAKDALWHVREILELMRKAMMSSYTPSGRLVLDENGTPSRAHSGIQVYNPAKPVKRAIKSFVLVDTVTNYILNFIVFCGKTTLSWSEVEADVAGAAGGPAAIDEGAADLRNIESDDEGEDDAEKVRFSCHVCVASASFHDVVVAYPTGLHRGSRSFVSVFLYVRFFSLPSSRTVTADHVQHIQDCHEVTRSLSRFASSSDNG